MDPVIIDQIDKPSIINREYSTIISPETYGFEPDIIADIKVDEEFRSHFREYNAHSIRIDKQSYQDQKAYFIVQEDENIVIAHEGPLTRMHSSRSSQTLRCYLAVSNQSALYDIVNILNKWGLGYVIKISQDMPRTDQICIYLMEQNYGKPIKKTEDHIKKGRDDNQVQMLNIQSAMREINKTAGDRIVPIKLPFAAQLRGIPSINFKQSSDNEKDISPNNLLARIIHVLKINNIPITEENIINALEERGYMPKNSAFVDSFGIPHTPASNRYVKHFDLFAMFTVNNGISINPDQF
jgi:hypothetical protein